MKAVIYMIICLSFCSELIHCSCLSYGHSCWGAHGKRSSNDRTDAAAAANDLQSDRWPLYKLIQDENIRERIFGRDRSGRVPTIDSLDYTEKRISNNVLNALRKQNPQLVLLNPLDEVAGQDMQNMYSTSNARKRRSNSNIRKNGINKSTDLSSSSSSENKSIQV